MNRATCTFVVGICAIVAAPALAEDCVWRPWATASWGRINTGPDLYPNNGIYNPTNWDYSFSQATVLNTPKTTPDSSTMALHWFLDAQPPETQSNGEGSGGVYQEITVTPNVPLKYSFWWRGAKTTNPAWFEFMLIDGPFNTYDADSRDGNTNPYIMRKRSDATFAWEQLTDQSVLYPGPVQSTLTPAGSTVTVVLKAGRWSPGAMESFFDDVQVWQELGVNLVVNGDFEQSATWPACDNQLMLQEGGYWLALSECPTTQHTTTSPVSPSSNSNDSDSTITITGTDLNQVTQVRLVPVGGGTDLVGTNLVVGAENTTLTADFPTTGAVDGLYDVVTVQSPAPPCLVQTLPATFEVTCPTAIAVTGVSPAEVTDPTIGVLLTVAGSNLDKVTGASLVYRVNSSPVITAASVSMVGSDLTGSFDLSCAPAGSYDLVLDRSDACRDKTVSSALRTRKTLPSSGCVWRPWAADWTLLNTGLDLDPDPENAVFDATNWDYSFSQHPTLGTVLDTPDGSSRALHWFLDGQAGYGDAGHGSGGVFQEITVQAGIPLEYSFHWKGASATDVSWFEFLLLDGPFSMQYADQFQESATANNPYMIRKTTLGNSSFDWQQVTDQTPADTGPAGPRPQTITPTGTTVTVILKAGRNPDGSMESLWDNVVVTQGGPNLIVNGDFESAGQTNLCDQELVSKDGCESNSWRRSSFVLLECLNWDPFADADQDGDVDQADFAVLQACYTGQGTFTLPPECVCFDRPEKNDNIDIADVLKFEDCASGPGVPANTACDD